MCTASWSVADSGLTLCFSRDERKTRSEATPPKIYSERGMRFIAAIDPDGGGTWAAVNERGLCVFLLNNYRACVETLARRKGLLSRGRLPVHFSGCVSRDTAARELRGYCLDRYNPFILCFADRYGVEGFAWNGAELTPVDFEGGMVTTCSFRTDEIESYRKRRYKELLGDDSAFSEEKQRVFHTELRHEDPAFNTLMLREESRTHSISTVRLSRHEIRFAYQPIVADERRLGEELVVSFADLETSKTVHSSLSQ